MTIQAYQTLFESSIAFGMRKCLQSEQRKAEMAERIDQLVTTCDELQSQVEYHSEHIDQLLEQER